jgi:Rrf2 family protein
MIVSRSADYALRALVYLARLDNHRYASANEISNVMQTPPFLLSRILQHLVKSDLLLSMKGHHGGFRLGRNADDISAFEVIHLVDGPFLVHDCTGKCGMGPDCNMKTIFSRAERTLGEVFRNVSIADLSQAPWTQAKAKNAVRFDHVVPGVE